jgi:hypothetical protein
MPREVEEWIDWAGATIKRSHKSGDMSLFVAISGCERCGGTHRACVPGQAGVPLMSARYEVSHKLSRPADRQRICRAVSFSITVMGPPQQGQSHQG